MKKSTKLILASVMAALVFSGGAAAWVIGILAGSPDFEKMRSQVKVPIKLANKQKSSRMVGPHAPGWVPLKTVSNHLLMAVIASEDASFFSHDGIDMHEIKLAIKKDIEEKRWARGASTITQQVVKNVFLTHEKTLTRKIRELIWARQLDRIFSKHEILAFYVNMVEWGPGIYGVGAASLHYFGKSASELTARESAFLAILLPSPWRYHAYFVKKELTPWAEKRVTHVLDVMNRMGFLEDDAYQVALSESLWGKVAVGAGEGATVPGGDGEAPPSDEAPAPEGASEAEMVPAEDEPPAQDPAL